MRARPTSARAASVTWKLHAEIVLLAGWGRAILLQLAHPLVARGVAAHSSFLTERWGRFARLHRTLSAMLTLTFGTPTEIERVARTINQIHDRINGTLPARQGVFPEGTSYTAHDPALLAWVHATLVDSFLRIYELLVAPLTPEERDRYCAESTAIGPLLGIPTGMLPTTAAALAEYVEAMLESGEIVVSDTARALGREVVNPPAFIVGRPLFALLRLPTVGLLPPSIRDGYGLPWNARRERTLSALAAITRWMIPSLPSTLRYWPIARAALRRETGG